LAGIGTVGLRMGRFSGFGADVPPVYRTSGDAGAGRARVCAPVSAGPGADPFAGGLAAQLRERAAVAEPPGATGETGFAGAVGCGRGPGDRPSTHGDYGVFGEAVVESATDWRAGQAGAQDCGPVAADPRLDREPSEFCAAKFRREGDGGFEHASAAQRANAGTAAARSENPNRSHDRSEPAASVG